MVDIASPIEAIADSLPAGSSLKDWSDKMFEASQIAGTPLNNAKLHKQRLEGAGFENVVETTYFWPQNTWPKDQRLEELGM